MKTICAMRDVFKAMGNFETAFEKMYQITLNEAMILCALKEASEKVAANATLTARVNVTNTGKYAGTEVVQLYVQDKVASVARPVKELKGFQRVTLQPGETKTVTFSLPVSELAFWNIDMKKVVEPGEFKLWLGTNSEEGLSADFEVIN